MNVCDSCLTLYFVTCEKNSEDQVGRKDDGGTDVGPSLEASVASVFLYRLPLLCVFACMVWSKVSSCGKADVKSSFSLDSSVWLLTRPWVFSTAALTTVVTCRHSHGSLRLFATFLFHHKSPLMVSSNLSPRWCQVKQVLLCLR